MYKLLLAASLALQPSSLVPAEAPPAYFVNIPAVKQVFCDEGRGTAFDAGGQTISVAHVTTMPGCEIEGKAIASHEEPGDFATIGDGSKGFKINCDGFKDGEWYAAIGYAAGLPVQRLVMIQATGLFAENGMAILLGYPTVIPGMSGGPIINMRGEVVGTVNMYSPIMPLSFSRELRDTSLCHD